MRWSARWWSSEAAVTNRHSLALAHIGVAVAAFGVAALMGVLQALSIADLDFPQRSEELYYISVTAHGVLMALVFTTFFIMPTSARNQESCRLQQTEGHLRGSSAANHPGGPGRERRLGHNRSQDASTPLLKQVSEKGSCPHRTTPGTRL